MCSRAPIQHRQGTLHAFDWLRYELDYLCRYVLCRDRRDGCKTGRTIMSAPSFVRMLRNRASFHIHSRQSAVLTYASQCVHVYGLLCLHELDNLAFGAFLIGEGPSSIRQDSNPTYLGIGIVTNLDISLLHRWHRRTCPQRQ